MKQTSEQKRSELKECKDIFWEADDKLIKYLDHFWENNPPPRLSWIERLYKRLKK